jgi:hypothetical protein
MIDFPTGSATALKSFANSLRYDSRMRALARTSGSAAFSRRSRSRMAGSRSRRESSESLAER